MTTYDPMAKIEDPVASPSRPSVRFTAFDTLVVMNTTQAMKIMIPAVAPKMATKSTLRFRTKEMAVDAGVCPNASW